MNNYSDSDDRHNGQSSTIEADNTTDAPAITVRVGMRLDDIEREVTLATLKHLNRHKERTAATLGISLKTLYNRLKQYAKADGAASNPQRFAMSTEARGQEAP